MRLIFSDFYFRNIYFEVPSQSGRPKRLSSMGISNDSTSEEKVKAFRGDLDMGSSKGRMPVEWQQWLRHTRRDPPTNHDILMNEALSMRTKQRALESDRKHQIWKEKVRLIPENPFQGFNLDTDHSKFCFRN